MSITTQRIRNLAKEQGRSLTYLCEKLGFKGRTYFTDIENSHRDIPTDKLIIIADLLNTTIDYLLGNTDDPTPKLKLQAGTAFFLSAHEAKVLTAYRDQPEMQPAVDKLLGVTMDGYVTVYAAANSASNHKHTITRIPQEKWDEIENEPNTDEELL